MSNKAKIGGRNKVVQKAVSRAYIVREWEGGFNCVCASTGRLIASGITAYDAKKRAGKRGWSEFDADLGA